MGGRGESCMENSYAEAKEKYGLRLRINLGFFKLDVELSIPVERWMNYLDQRKLWGV